MSVNEEDLKDPTYWIRWSINSGLMVDLAKDSLYSYAYLCHKDVKAAEISINISTKTVDYTIYLPLKTLNAYNKYNRLINSDGIISLWRAKRLIKKYGNLEVKRVLSDFVNKLCGPEWTIKLIVKNERDYVEPRGDEQT